MQPDQDPTRWDAFVAGYERVFEPLTNAFAAQALAALAPLGGMDLLDLGAGTGGAALLAAQAGACVTAVDGSPAMVARIAARIAARTAGLAVTALQQDGMALDMHAQFDRALSCFGVVLFPDPARGMAALHRALRPGGRAAVVTWTEPHRYALAARLREATIATMGEPPAGELPAQLRFTDPAIFASLLEQAGFADIHVERLEATLHHPSAAGLAASLAFAPGMTATLDALGPHRPAVLHAFTAALERDFGQGPVSLGAVAHVAVGRRLAI